MICDVIKDYLNRNKIQQTWLANKIKMSKQLLNNKLTGDTRISIEEYVDICDALEVDYGYFIRCLHAPDQRKATA